MINLGKTEAGYRPLSIELTLQAEDFHAEWKRCNMLANYIAEYIAYQYIQRERAENLISTIANEFLEAIVHLAPGKSELTIRCTQLETGLRLNADHQIHSQISTAYADFVKDLCQEASDVSYLELLTSTQQPNQYFNQLGLTMLAHDFGACMKVNFQDENHVATEILIATEEFQA